MVSLPSSTADASRTPRSHPVRYGTFCSFMKLGTLFTIPVDAGLVDPIDKAKRFYCAQTEGWQSLPKPKRLFKIRSLNAGLSALELTRQCIQREQQVTVCRPPSPRPVPGHIDAGVTERPGTTFLTGHPDNEFVGKPSMMASGKAPAIHRR